MSKLEEQIAAAEQKLKMLKARQVRAATRQRTRDAKQHRRDDLRRKILVGSAMLGLVERGEIGISVLAGWLQGTLTRDEDRKLFSDYWESLGKPEAEAPAAAEGKPELLAANVESGRSGREIRPDG
jgi:hypothetical protein